ncbi:MAG: hypothetical protein ACLRLD_06305 [Lachnospira sp.]|jgi:hypothetical protein
MKIKLIEVEKTVKELNQISSKRLPVLVSYAIRKNCNILTEELKDVSEVRCSILENYAKKDGDGNVVIEDGKYQFENTKLQETALEEVNKLYDKEADIQVTTISLEELKAVDENELYDKLTGQEVDSLMFMIE